MRSLFLHEAYRLCPYCNEPISILLDSSLQDQEYIEDCEVCCQPFTVQLNWQDEDDFELRLYRQDEVC